MCMELLVGLIYLMVPAGFFFWVLIAANVPLSTTGRENNPQTYMSASYAGSRIWNAFESLKATNH